MTDRDDHQQNDRPTPARRRRGHSGMRVFAPWLNATRPERDARRLADQQDRDERRAIAARASDSPLNAMYAAMGHSPDCIARIRGGLIVSCDCEAKPVDDPAVALALALQYEKFARAGRIAFPRSIARLVEAGAEKGDEACRVMLARLRRRGLIDREGGATRSGKSPGRPS
jgi:hypothetical protein